MNLFKPTHPSDSYGLNKLIRKIHGIYNTWSEVQIISTQSYLETNQQFYGNLTILTFVVITRVTVITH
jgi:hypothetical protein